MFCIFLDRDITVIFVQIMAKKYVFKNKKASSVLRSRLSRITGQLAILITVFCIFSTFSGCSFEKEEPISSVTSDHLHHWNELLEAAIVTDFFSPPVAGRIYVYPNVAAYEILAQKDTAFLSLAGKQSDLSIPSYSNQLDEPEIAAVFAFYHTSIQLVYSIEVLENGLADFRAECKEAGVDEEAMMAAENYGKSVAENILAWAKKDGYAAMRSYPRYQLLQQPGTWIPTPPDYSEALEPHWSKLRPFTLDSAAQFKPASPTAFDMDTGSLFFQETKEVYHALRNNTPETEAIAKFWDCNPLVKKHQGHVTFAEKKLTPGGHWVNIGRMAMQEKQLDLMATSHAYVLLTIGIYDAFISCWDEKYRSNYVRPVTVIHEHIDPEWTPILYTPNFPEYPSGHSVVSGSAATILTELFGENYAFTDFTEVPYGMPPRSFQSFFEASDEAAISRMYGGIHFMPAIENGKSQGRQVGQHVLNTIQLKTQP